MTHPTERTPDETAARRRQVLLGGGLVAALLLGGTVLLTSGGAEQEDVEPFVALPRAAAAAPPAPATSPPPPASSEQPAGVPPSGRNPFAVLYAAPVAAPPAASPAPEAGASTDAPETPDTRPPGNEAPGDAADAPAGDPADAPAGDPAGTPVPGKGTDEAGVRVWIEMDGGVAGLDPAERARNAEDGTWTFRVGTSATDPQVRDHVVAPGDEFATHFRLLRLSYDAQGRRHCAQLQFGDSTLDLCEADSSTLRG